MIATRKVASSWIPAAILARDVALHAHYSSCYVNVHQIFYVRVLSDCEIARAHCDHTVGHGSFSLLT